LGKLFAIICRRILGDVTNDRGADSEIEQAVVAGYGKDEHPDSERGVAQAVNDKWRKEDADDNIDGERRPARADVL
jgi:hypothetical protein